jgi:hypothetical protein
MRGKLETTSPGGRTPLALTAFALYRQPAPPRDESRVGPHAAIDGMGDRTYLSIHSTHCVIFSTFQPTVTDDRLKPRGGKDE